MKQHGSVLVVVLGLLAILAVIGVAFLTLSSLERSTAASFALQSQMMIAADGALDYAVHQMVTDVWEWRIPEANKFEFTGNLLTGRQAGLDPIDGKTYAACETYDYPAADDPWLSGNITGNTEPNPISFAGDVVKRFGVNFGGTTAAVDNLGMPVTAPAKNGIWIPDLAAPCDQYLVRASVTILDHNALVNLNAHGSKVTGAWEYGDCLGKGYFVSDAVPPVTDLNALLFGTGAVPGCWGSDGPGNSKTGAALIENPAATGTGLDAPYTLDEEFELRNLWGTYFKSRLEWFWPALLSDPANASGYAQRLKTTTVSWTAEVRGDGKATSHAIMTDLGWSAAKADLNTASPDDIYKALLDGRAWDDDDVSKTKLKQFVANIIAFRRQIGATVNFTTITIPTINGTPYVGAVRQPILSEATCQLTKEEDVEIPDPKDPTKTITVKDRTYTVKVEVYNPWPGDHVADTDSKLRTDMTVTFDVDPPHEVFKPGAIPPPLPPPTQYPKQTLSTPTAGDDCCAVAGVKWVERQVVCHSNATLDATLKDALKSIRLHWTTSWQGKVLNLDLIDDTNVADIETAGRIYRNVDFEDERRGTKNNFPIRVFYVSDWNSGGSANLGTATKDPGLRTSAIPIRFPNCVLSDAASNLVIAAPGLPVRAASGADFKAFARVGDLNQVLLFKPGPDKTGANTWWAEPWIVTVSKKSRTQENEVKFDWMKNIDKLDNPDAFVAARAANVLSVGGPWNDGLDNDGDTQLDFADNGTGTGRPGGPEFRVAGKVNLNTAISETLTALGISAASLPTKPIKSPAQVLTASATPNGIEVRDEPFARISNIATVRSDTFSVYGTVQIVDPTTAVNSNLPDSGIVRSRRFWALVDRSPSLAYPPNDKDPLTGKNRFIYPRILNFQWLD